MFLHLLNAGNKKISNILLYIAFVLLGLMTIIVLIQVYYRYILNNSLSFTEELGRLFMVWMVFFVAPFALKNGENISMTFILDKFIHTFTGRVVQNLINLIILLVVIFSFIESIKMAISGMDIISATIGIKMGYVYSPVVISLLILLSVAIENLFKSLCALFKYKES